MKDIWLPIITPLKDGSIDIPSYKGLIDHYISQNISGLIPMGTTGESPAFDAYEKELLLNVTLEQVDGRVPVFFGLGGNYTDKVVRQLRQLENSGIDGILSVCPYYNRPSQEGIYRHFESIAGSTDLDVLLYNIPYRTGRNIENDTLLRLGEIPNVIGVKDACGDFAQTTRLLMDKPSDFSVLSGDDATLFSALALGAEGAVSASAHLMTQGFVDLFSAFQEMDLMEAKKYGRTCIRSSHTCSWNRIRLPLNICCHLRD